jgi:hypothetical protein
VVVDLLSVQMGYGFSAFAWSCVLTQLPGGWLLVGEIHRVELTKSLLPGGSA